jgi:hypothetical protein
LLEHILLWDFHYIKYYTPPYPILPQRFKEDMDLITISIVPDTLLGKSHMKLSLLGSPLNPKTILKEQNPYLFLTSTSQDSLDSNEIPLPFHIANQHLHAHKYVKSLKSLGRISSTEFYDLFVCPIKVLFSIGMPLQSLFAQAAV